LLAEKPFKTRRKRLFGYLWNIGSPIKSPEQFLSYITFAARAFV
jgi:hypothetical protein